MKLILTYLSRVMIVFGAALAIGLLSGFAGDPSDDFSFSFSPSSDPAAFRLMQEHEVAALLGDRLDVFPRSLTGRLARHLVDLCRKYRFDPAFILSLIDVESGFRVGVISPKGAVGLMQLAPGTAALVAQRYQIHYRGARSLVDPFTNVSIGVAYLSYLRERYQGLNPYYHIAAYNIGPGKMDELRSRKSFKADKTKKYYEAIQSGVPAFRFYRGDRDQLAIKGHSGV